MGQLGPWDLGLNNLVKDHQAMLHIKFQAPKPSSSGEEDFKVYFISEPMTPCGRAILDSLAQGHLGSWDLHLNELGIGLLGNATYQFQAS